MNHFKSKNSRKRSEVLQLIQRSEITSDITEMGTDEYYLLCEVVYEANIGRFSEMLSESVESC